MGKLYVVSTPIGNLNDITFRAVEILNSVDYIACEDTRRGGLLLNSLNKTVKPDNSKTPKFISYYEETELTKSGEILKILQGGLNVALISDAGTPLVSDPGFRLISLCIKNDIQIIPVPGASSVLTVLAASGYPANNFWFLGFLPAKETKCLGFLKKLYKGLLNIESDVPAPTIIFYESPYRLITTLQNLKLVFGDINICIGRELTKIHEEIKTELLSYWITYYSENQPKGEFTLLFNLKF